MLQCLRRELQKYAFSKFDFFRKIVYTIYTKDKKETNYNKCGYKSPIVVLKI